MVMNDTEDAIRLAVQVHPLVNALSKQKELESGEDLTPGEVILALLSSYTEQVRARVEERMMAPPVPSVVVSSDEVKALHAQTGAAMKDCILALHDARGDFSRAADSLHRKGQA